MTKISNEEIINIARMSAIAIQDNEIEPLKRHVEAVLSYAERVKEIACFVEEPSHQNTNVFREDVVVKTDQRLIMVQAPLEESDYFIVPSILAKR
jgi:aspartyl-tRNA(Asn)/glutamyl-tRNA(Gln) amidotransferase subunit C